MNEADADDLACKMQTKTAGAAVRLQKIQTFASHFSFKFIFFSHENNWLCLGIFSLREIAGSLLAHSLINFTSHAIKRRQHSTERDVDLHLVIKCVKKLRILYDRSKQINIRDLQNILKLLSSREHEHALKQFLRKVFGSRYRCQFGGVLPGNVRWPYLTTTTPFNFLFEIVAQFLV